MSHPAYNKWFTAVKDKYSSLIENNMWRLVKPLIGRKVLKARWVFNYKRDATSSIIRFKARWVTKGYEQ